MIQFEDTTHRYNGEQDPPAVSDVTFSLARGGSLALVGPNGSGKSTIAHLCNGLLAPTEGRVLVEGMDTRDPDLVWDARAKVGLVMQHPDEQIVGVTVERDCAFGPENLGTPPAEVRTRVEAALETVKLKHLSSAEPHTLSQGEKQRLALAGVLAMRPDYLVLDEVTSMLDSCARRSILKLALDVAREVEAGVLVITHRLEEIAQCDEVIVLEQGAIVWRGIPTSLAGDAVLLTRAGVKTPAVFDIARELRASGVPIPMDTVDPDRLVRSLWP